MQNGRLYALALIAALLLAACAPQGTPAGRLAASSRPGSSTPTSLTMPTLSATTATRAIEGTGGTSVPPAYRATTPAAPVTAAAAPVTITFATMQEDRAVYTRLIEAFEQRNPKIHVQLVELEPLVDQDIFTATPAVLHAADVAELPASADPLQHDLFYDLKPLMDADPTFDRRDFYTGALGAVSQDDGVYLLPRFLHVPLLFYNRRLWQAKGLAEPRADWSWADLVAAARQVAAQRAGAIDVYGLLDTDVRVTWISELAVRGVSAEQQASVRLDDPRVVAALERVVTAIKMGAIYAPSLTPAALRGDAPPDDSRIVEQINHQQVAMWSPSLCCYDPAQLQASFAVGAVPLPQPAFSFMSSVNGYAISSATRHPEAAWRWIAFLSGQEYAGGLRFDGVEVPARISAATQTGFWQRLDPASAAALRSIAASPGGRRLIRRPAPILLRPALFDTDLRPVLSAVLTGSQTAQAALQAAQRVREQRLAQEMPAAPTPGRPAGTSPTAEGRQVDVGGYHLFVDCEGTGTPTVLLDAGLGNPSSVWSAVQPGVSPFTRVCRYDRAGLGGSDTGPRPRTSHQIVDELHRLLERAHIDGPYMLVGASFGGLNIQLFASMYPRDTVGMVLVDATHPDLDARIEKLLSPSQVQERRADLAANDEHVTFDDLLASDSQVRAAAPLPDVPAVVLRHGLPFESSSGWPRDRIERLWADLQVDLARRLPHSHVVVAEHSGHRIHQMQPELVIAAIQEVVQVARTSPGNGRG